MSIVPYKKRQYKKRQYKKGIQNNKNQPSTQVVNLPTGVPDRLLTQMKYTASFNLVDAVGAIDTIQVIRGNSIYDPDYTGTGTQPTGRDQWVNLYTTYRVHGSKINVKVINNESSSTTGNCCVSLVAENDAPPSTALCSSLQRANQPYSKQVLIPPVSAGGNPIEMEMYMSTKKIFGEKDINDSNYRAAFTTNPLRQWYWGVQCQNLNGSTHNLIVVINITYYVELLDRVELGPS